MAGHDSYGAWREGAHDDLLLSVALACWAAEKRFLPKGLLWPRVSTGRRRIRGISNLGLWAKALDGVNTSFHATWVEDHD